jgi:hypothetical protein
MTRRRSIQLAVVAALSLAISACGSSSDDKASSTATTTTPVALHTIDAKEAHLIPLHTPISGVVAKLGEPRHITRGIAPVRKKHKGKLTRVEVLDYYYGIKGRPGATADFTFVKGSLASVLISG